MTADYIDKVTLDDKSRNLCSVEGCRTPHQEAIYLVDKKTTLPPSSNPLLRCSRHWTGDEYFTQVLNMVPSRYEMLAAAGTYLPNQDDYSRDVVVGSHMRSFLPCFASGCAMRERTAGTYPPDSEPTGSSNVLPVDCSPDPYGVLAGVCMPCYELRRRQKE